MDRRDFLKLSCSLCVAVGAGITVGSTLTSCATTAIYKTPIEANKISVPVSLFAEKNFQIVRPQGLEYDLGVRKELDGTYRAILLRCTHADNPVMSTGSGFLCNMHGSEFDKDGHVTKGPAARDLKTYPTRVESENIIITLI